ncbi:MAG: S-formylglutathione hydrolase [Myxococcales bacterium]|nr:S-formylglutathione hydrolase [Myxococcales bacterium]MCB9735740.1 S-formylglutathione hydrolase [Deltaproteobacteria bacterium]
MKEIERHIAFGGVQSVYEHVSRATGTAMRFAVFVPPAPGPRPVLYWLSGLTCNEQNFVTKAGAQRVAAELGLVIVAPDTSPRGEGVADVEAWDMGQGAGFYVDATEAPWSRHFKMWTYVTQELPELVAATLPVDPARQGVSGHSMGGHGALVAGIRHPERFRSVSAFSPICEPSACPWGVKALGGYLGDDRRAWAEYDAAALVRSRGYRGALLVDQGLADGFLAEQLRPEALEEACEAAGVELALRRHEGYDHSYYFVATFIEDHLRFHAEVLDR